MPCTNPDLCWVLLGAASVKPRSHRDRAYEEEGRSLLTLLGAKLMAVT